MKRIAYFDNAKGILIILIVLAHVLSLCSSYYNYNDDFFKFASLFMLQGFFIISAYFSSKSKTSTITKVKSKLKTYLLWQTIITLYYAFILNIIDFNLNYLIPRYTLWFLITLIFYDLSEFILEKVNYKIMIPLSFVIGLVSGFIPFFGRPLSLSRTFVFFPFYVIGYYAKEIDLWNKIKKPKVIKTTFILSIIILIITLTFSDLIPLKILKGKFNYFNIGNTLPWVACLQRLLFYLFSLIVTTTFFNIVPKKESIITRLGQNTLYIYLTQGMILKTFVTEKILLNNEVTGTILLFSIALLLTILSTKFIKTLISKYRMEIIHEQKISRQKEKILL